MILSEEWACSNCGSIDPPLLVTEYTVSHKIGGDLSIGEEVSSNVYGNCLLCLSCRHTTEVSVDPGLSGSWIKEMGARADYIVTELENKLVLRKLVDYEEG
jgi:hypothetical protein